MWYDIKSEKKRNLLQYQVRYLKILEIREFFLAANGLSSRLTNSSGDHKG